MNQPHYDQLSPVDGVHQVMPDGSFIATGSSHSFELPSLAPPFEPDAQQALTEQVEAQRAQLAKPAGNLDTKGAPHFLRVVDGEEVCGQCAQEFPCEAYRAITSQARLDQLTGKNPHASLIPPTMEEAARAAGLDPQEFADRLRQTRGL